MIRQGLAGNRKVKLKGPAASTSTAWKDTSGARPLQVLRSETKRNDTGTPTARKRGEASCGLSLSKLKTLFALQSR